MGSKMLRYGGRYAVNRVVAASTVIGILAVFFIIFIQSSMETLRWDFEDTQSTLNSLKWDTEDIESRLESLEWDVEDMQSTLDR